MSASLLSVVPSAAGAQPGGLEVELPPNTDCRGSTVIAKAAVVEDAAAANMLAEALRELSPGGKQRCLLDAGDSSAAARSSAGLASTVYVVGGPTAIPESRLRSQFGLSSFVRVAGADRWQTQENVAAAILALANDDPVQPYDPEQVAAATLTLSPNGDCRGTAVLAKLTVAEERAAANMLAVALTAVSGDHDSRCLVDVGDPGADRPPSAVSVAEAALASGAYLLGGEVAVPPSWIDNGFDIRFLERISGPDRWATQAAVAKTIIDIAQGGTLPHQHIDGRGRTVSVYDDAKVVLNSQVQRGIKDAGRVSSPSGTTNVFVFTCYNTDKEEDGEYVDKLEQLRAKVVEAAEKDLAKFFRDQSSGEVDFKFVDGGELRVKEHPNAGSDTSEKWDGPFELHDSSTPRFLSAICENKVEDVNGHNFNVILLDQRVERAFGQGSLADDIAVAIVPTTSRLMKVKESRLGKLYRWLRLS